MEGVSENQDMGLPENGGFAKNMRLHKHGTNDD